MKKLILFIFCAALSQPLILSAAEDGNKNADKGNYAWQESKSADDYAQDPFFNGVVYKNGPTTIVQGETIGADPSALRGGQLSPEDLQKLERHIVSVTNGSGSVTTSESHSNRSFFHSSSTQNNQTTDLNPGLTITEQKK